MTQSVTQKHLDGLAPEEASSLLLRHPEEMLLILRGDGSISYVSDGLAAQLPGSITDALPVEGAPEQLIDDTLIVDHRSFWDLVLERFSAFEFIEDVDATLLTRNGGVPVLVTANLAPIGADGNFAVVLRLSARQVDSPISASSDTSGTNEDEELLRLANIGRSSRTLVHEILNPLAVIMGSLDLIDNRMRGDGPVDTEKLRDLHARMRRATEHIARITRGVGRLAAARGDAGATSTVLNEAISIVVDWYQGDLSTNGISVQRGDAVSDVTLAVCCPRHVIVQVLTNIVMNARDAILRSNPVLKRIDIYVKRIGSFVELTVTDSGGPPSATAPKRDGFGIGLNVSRQVLATYGGYLLRHTNARPTRFVVVLPVA